MWSRDLPRSAPARDRDPDDGNSLLESVHRRGLEEQALELQSLYRRTKLQLAESQDELRRYQLKVHDLEEANEAALAKIATLESIKSYSMELQSRLAFAEQQAEERKLELNACRNDAIALRRQLDDGLRREDDQARRGGDLEQSVRQLRELLRQTQDEKELAQDNLHRAHESLAQLEQEHRHKDSIISRIEHDKVRS